MKQAIRTAVRLALGRRVRRIGDEDAAAYLRSVAAPTLGITADGVIERTATGANTAVMRWETGEKGTLYARLWPWRQKTRPVLQHRTAAAMLGEAGLATPEIVFGDDTLETARRWGFEAVIERAAPGRPLSAIPAEEGEDGVGQVAGDLARLHARRGKAWGRPWLPGGARRPGAYWRERIGKFRQRITEETCGLTSEEIRQALGQLQAGLEPQATRTPVLVHGDVSPGHLYPDGSGGLVWIDYETVEFGAAEQDLATVGLWVRGRRYEVFLETYEQACGHAVDRAALRVFAMLMHWERLNSRVQRRRKMLRRVGAKAGAIERVEHERRAAEQAIRMLAGPT
jgi:hypothetical protein